MPELRVSPDLALPLDLVVQKIGVLARSGAGKTNTAVDIVEELLEHDQQVVILDPPGAWWGLRTSADGKQPGYPVIVLGGVHGDLPLESTSGELIADLVVDQGLSAVLDLSEFESDAAVYRFVEAFARRLFARKNRIRDPMMLVIEEADELAPQTVRPEQAKLLHAMERLAKRGRMRGIGFLAISQRTASLNWNVLSQIEVLIALQTTAALDIKAIDGWLRHQLAGNEELRRQILSELSKLPIGTGYLTSPAWLRLTRKVHFRRRRTFDSSATPEPGKRVVQPKTRADVDLEALRGKLAATIEKAKADDPRELRKRIADLEGQIRERPALVNEATSVRVHELERELAIAQREFAIRDELLKRQGALFAVLRSDIASVTGTLESMAAKIAQGDDRNALIEMQRKPVAAVAVPRIDPIPAEHRRPPPSSPAPRPQPVPAPDGGAIAPSEQKLLDVLADMEALGLDATQRATLGAFSGYSASGGRFQNLLGRLRSSALIEYPSSGTVALTEAGRAVAKPSASVRTLEDLHVAWFRQVGPSAARVLGFLISRYPEEVTREALAEATGYEARGGRFQNILGQLRSAMVIDYPGTGRVRATEVLFPNLPRHA